MKSDGRLPPILGTQSYQPSTCLVRDNFEEGYKIYLQYPKSFFSYFRCDKDNKKVKRLKKKKVKRYNNCYLLKTWQRLFKSSLTIVVSIFPQSTLITTLANRLKSDDRLPLIQASWHRVNQLSYGSGENVSSCLTLPCFHVPLPVNV